MEIPAYVIHKTPCILSIIVPIYNAEQYLSRCLEKLCSCTMQDIEVLCVDDGSTDDSALILDKYAAWDARITVYHQENRGLPAVRNRGLSLAKGRYISFVDSDDVADVEMFPRFVEVMEQEPGIDLCICDAVRMYPDGSQKRMFETCSAHRLCALDAWEKMVEGRYFFWYLWGKVYRRSVFDGFRADESVTASEDLDTQWKLFSEGHIRDVWYDPTFCYQYVWQPQSMTEHMGLYEKIESDLRVYERILQSASGWRTPGVERELQRYRCEAEQTIKRERCFYGEEREELFASVFIGMQSVIDTIERGVPLYLYGTGMIARYAAEMVEKGRVIEGFVVSDGEPNIGTFRDKPVQNIGELAMGRKVVLLALNNANRDRVLRTGGFDSDTEIVTLDIPEAFL